MKKLNRFISLALTLGLALSVMATSVSASKFVDAHGNELELDDTLDTRACIEACKKAFRVARPEILNSDQGCQFTSQEYKEFLKENHVRQSMDGKSRWADNIRIERWFRSFKV